MTAVKWLDRWFRDNPEATHIKLNKAIEVLTHFQQWCKGTNVEMLSPKQVTYAIDTLLNYHIVDTNKMIEHTLCRTIKTNLKQNYGF